MSNMLTINKFWKSCQEKHPKLDIAIIAAYMYSYMCMIQYLIILDFVQEVFKKWHFSFTLKERKKKYWDIKLNNFLKAKFTNEYTNEHKHTISPKIDVQNRWTE